MAEARDGAAWFSEWLTLPPLVAAAARAIAVTGELAQGVEARPHAMARHLDDPLGLIHAEALSFALAPSMGRADAQAEIKALAAKARESGTPLPDLVANAHPDVDRPELTAPATLGTAPSSARSFAKAARERAASIAERHGEKN